MPYLEFLIKPALLEQVALSGESPIPPLSYSCCTVALKILFIFNLFLINHFSVKETIPCKTVLRTFFYTNNFINFKMKKILKKNSKSLLKCLEFTNFQILSNQLIEFYLIIILILIFFFKKSIIYIFAI